MYPNYENKRLYELDKCRSFPFYFPLSDVFLFYSFLIYSLTKIQYVNRSLHFYLIYKCTLRRTLFEL